ncbi:MAG: hypothetical protein COC06_08620 [Bacteroidales bacterium]|nr:MAG: hypothetical protein COC06_08620 [Bacteroidales bacterium]
MNLVIWLSNYDWTRVFYGENLTNLNGIWIDDDVLLCNYTTHPRANVEYTGEKWKNKLYHI